MKDANLQFLRKYKELIKNQARLIELASKDPMAPVDATRGMEAELKRFREEFRDRVLDILVEEALEHFPKEDGNGR